MFNLSEIDAENRLYHEKSFYSQGFNTVAGVDEAGRGPLAGPVVAGCVYLTCEEFTDIFKDSKVLSESRRAELYDNLVRSCHVFGIGVADVHEIEQINIHQASLLAMKRAVDDCNKKIPEKTIDCLLVDGRSEVPLPLPQRALIKGETKSCSIAAASIVAKITRDQMMLELHDKYPHYNFSRNQGYPTLEHRKALQQYGPSPVHRRTFKGVREFYDQQAEGPNFKQTSFRW
jgi:ribonuclease HII